MPLLYGKGGDPYIVAGSKGGASQHPAWYLNICANPEVDVQVAETKFCAMAYTAAGAERQRLWHRMAEIFPSYLDYQQRTEREIPVIVLVPEK